MEKMVQRSGDRLRSLAPAATRSSDIVAASPVAPRRRVSLELPTGRINMSTDEGTESTESPLDRAAAGGPLAGVAAEDEMEEQGDDVSDTADADEAADEAGRGDIVGGVNMH